MSEEEEEEEEERPRIPGRAREGAAQGAGVELPLMQRVSAIRHGPQLWPWP